MAAEITQRRTKSPRLPLYALPNQPLTAFLFHIQTKSFYNTYIEYSFFSFLPTEHQKKFKSFLFLKIFLVHLQKRNTANVLFYTLF